MDMAHREATAVGASLNCSTVAVYDAVDALSERLHWPLDKIAMLLKKHGY